MIRIGSEIENVLCDKLSGKIDTTKEYDSKLLIDSFRNDPKFNFVDSVVAIGLARLKLKSMLRKKLIFLYLKIHHPMMKILK